MLANGILRRLSLHPCRLEYPIKDFNSKRSNQHQTQKTCEPGDLSGFVGKRFVYTYDNGWVYEWYARNETTCDYRIHQGLVGGRWVRQQRMYATQFACDIYRVDWHEPTGTCVSLTFNLNALKIHGTIFFPQWIAGEGQHPEKTIVFQNVFMNEMERFRDEGPAYPYVIIPEYAKITSVENVGLNNDEVINKAPGQLEVNKDVKGIGTVE